MDFVSKNLDDIFYIEDSQHIDIKNKIFREVSANMLIHREFSNAFPASSTPKTELYLQKFSFSTFHSTTIILGSNRSLGKVRLETGLFFLLKIRFWRNTYDFFKISRKIVVVIKAYLCGNFSNASAPFF